MRLSRTTRRTSSRSASTFSLRTALESTSSRMCEPPCRSRPSTRWRCAQRGQDCTTCSGKKLGIAKAQTTRVVSRIAAAFQRDKYTGGDNQGRGALQAKKIEHLVRPLCPTATARGPPPLPPPPLCPPHRPPPRPSAPPPPPRNPPPPPRRRQPLWCLPRPARH